MDLSAKRCGTARRGAVATILLLLGWHGPASAQGTEVPGGAGPGTGTISGRILSVTTQRPVIGATVRIGDTGPAVMSDQAGAFSIGGVPPGSHTLHVVRQGFRTRGVPDVVVRPGGITSVEILLEPAALEVEGITVRPSFFRAAEERPTSAIEFSAEEIRRAPGSAGDISRIILGLPSLAKVNDQYNGLAVRGGSPAENLFLVDNIPIPNLNHFPAQGSSGGAIGLLNVDLVRDVQFQSGGFGAAYGGRLSSVVEIALREGNGEQVEAQGELDFTGFGAIAEGPLPGRGSWMASARRSYLDLLVKRLDVGTTLAPRYGDAQAKLTYAWGRHHRISALGVWAHDEIRSDLATAIENDMQVYGPQDLTQSTLGINWRALWSRAAISNTSVSMSSSRFDERFTETATGLPLLDNRSRERAIRVRNVNQAQLGAGAELRFGVEAERVAGGFGSRYGAHVDPHGRDVPALTLDEELVAPAAAAFVSIGSSGARRLSPTLGLRADLFGLGGHLRLAPRAALAYRLADGTTLNASAGLYHQQLPLVLLAQSHAHREIATPRAVHLVAGIQHLLASDTRLTLEAYHKSYRNLPLDPERPATFVLDEPVAGNGFFAAHDELVPEGRARSSGVEAIVQKKLSYRVYGMASAAYSRARYRPGDGVWRDRVYDNRLLLSAEGGFRPTRNWELSGRWMFAGGPPHTPIDPVRSRARGQTMLDADRVNEARYPDYHSLNVRVDRRFHFRRSALSAYLSVWNAYNRRNVAAYFWNPRAERVQPIHQWGVLPIFGVRYEF